MELTLLALEAGKLANHIDVVRDGAEALAYLFRSGAYAGRPLENDPRVVLLDIKLPLVNGIDVLRRLKESDETRHLPVVMLTSSDEDRDLAECYKLGANSYIVKPVDVDKFFESMRQIGLYWLVLNRSEVG
jgi:CheY-like chemotaxis protein